MTYQDQNKEGNMGNPTGMRYENFYVAVRKLWKAAQDEGMKGPYSLTVHSGGHQIFNTTLLNNETGGFDFGRIWREASGFEKINIQLTCEDNGRDWIVSDLDLDAPINVSEMPTHTEGRKAAHV